jgi:hypothetical protein
VKTETGHGLSTKITKNTKATKDFFVLFVTLVVFVVSPWAVSAIFVV